MHTDLFLLSDLEFKLLNSFQRDFPLRSRPFAVLAKRLDADELTVIATLQRLQLRGLIARVGPVFRSKTIGASALAAVAVPPERLEQLANIISAFAEVSHNYARDDAFNLWFVLAAPSAQRVADVLQEIENACDDAPMMVLPLEEEYRVDVGFDMSGRAASPPAQCDDTPEPSPVALSDRGRALVAALQDGIPLVPRPFAALGMPEVEAIGAIARWLDDGIVRRFGVIVRHEELGYAGHALAVWDVPDDAAGELGRRMAAWGEVGLCCRRRRHLPDWPYNLYCTLHGRDRGQLADRIAALAAECGLDAYPHRLLFRRRRFKQRGAHYAVAPEVQHG